jgi:hypothetical protein
MQEKAFLPLKRDDKTSAMKAVADNINFFLRLHKGRLNIFLHLLGFAGVIFSLWRLDWGGFAASFLVLEFGHLYNHVRDIEVYDFRPRVLALRLFFFLLFTFAVYGISRFYS